MIHKMKLRNTPFLRIKEGSKTIEMRLYDEKRKMINKNDLIEFTNIDTSEVLTVNVLDIHIFNNFEELYRAFNKQSIGYRDEEVASFSDMNTYYCNEDIKKYGVVGIEIELIK
ncbi:MAG: ASCH domain-containing protein [Bacilli bacterium]